MSTLKTRLELRDIFLEILERLDICYRSDTLSDSNNEPIFDSNNIPVSARFREDGHLYFQPPPGVKMKYPAVVYELSDIPSRHADNRPYIIQKRYTVTVIDKDPDSELPDELAALPTADMSRFFTSENLNHWVFSVYF